MKKYLLMIAAAWIFALAAVITVGPGRWNYFRFKLGHYDLETETQEVVASLRLFSATMASFYMTGGSQEGLNVFPAGTMIKRRIFTDLSSLGISGKVLVIDRDKTMFRNVDFLSPVHAAAATDEDWYFVYQDAKTRRQLSSKKFNPVTVRYYLKKEWGKWIVLDYDVFSREEALTPIDAEKIIRW